MDKLSLTNLILNYYNDKGVPTEITELSADKNDDGEIITQVQIDIDFNEKGSFAFFFRMEDDEIYFSDIYELINPLSEEEFNVLSDEYLDDLGPFDAFLGSEEGGLIHLCGRLSINDFAEELLDNIYAFYAKSNNVLLEKLDTIAL